MVEIKDRMIEFYADVCKRTAELSRAKRLKVGSLIVKNGNFLAFGWNGTPIGWDNDCEKRTYFSLSPNPLIDEKGNAYELETKPEVIHSEMNSLYKLAKSNESGLGAIMFCTHSPCLECSKGIFMSGIKMLYYGEDYRSRSGLELLEKSGVEVKKW